MRVSVGVTRKRSVSPQAAALRIGLRVQRGVAAVAQELLNESGRLVPKDTEALYLSGRWSLEDFGLNSVARVGYGVPGQTFHLDSPREGGLRYRTPFAYALAVHEDMNVPHQNGQANFLVGPMNTHRAGLRQALLLGVRR